MRTFLKSLAAGLVGMGLFFCFFMMVSLAALELRGAARLQGMGEVISPLPWFRYVGLPLSAVSFGLSFAVGWKKFSSVRQ